ncbi:hypothetical protein LVY75_33635 (plasmid) [Sinorhizobium sp. B11]
MAVLQEIHDRFPGRCVIRPAVKQKYRFSVPSARLIKRYAQVVCVEVGHRDLLYSANTISTGWFLQMLVPWNIGAEPKFSKTDRPETMMTIRLLRPSRHGTNATIIVSPDQRVFLSKDLT